MPHAAEPHKRTVACSAKRPPQPLQVRGGAPGFWHVAYCHSPRQLVARAWARGDSLAELPQQSDPALALLCRAYLARTRLLSRGGAADRGRMAGCDACVNTSLALCNMFPQGIRARGSKAVGRVLRHRHGWAALWCAAIRARPACRGSTGGRSLSPAWHRDLWCSSLMGVTEVDLTAATVAAAAHAVAELKPRSICGWCIRSL